MGARLLIGLRESTAADRDAAIYAACEGHMKTPIAICYGLMLFGDSTELRQYRTNELVRRRMNFSSDAMADFEGLLEVNRKICQQQMAEKASHTLPTNCAVLP